MEQRIRCLVIGSINMDLVLNVHSVPVAGESCLADRYRYFAGGKGANQAAAAARLGALVTFIGKIGNDANGLQLLETQKAFGVDTACVKTDPSAPTGLAVVMVEPDGKNRILVCPGSNMLLTPEDVVPVIESGSFDVVILQLEIPQETVITACRAARKRNIPVILDMGPAQVFPLQEIAGVAILSPNETETLALCGILPDTEEKAREAAMRLMDKSNAGYVVIKRGAYGAYVYGKGVDRNFDAPKVTAVDTTAAGDAFTAALAIGYMATGDIGKAAVYANRVGALSVTRAGAQASLPSYAEVEEFMRAAD